MSNNTTTLDPYTQSLLPKCEGPPYNAQPVIDGVPELPKDINIAMIGGISIANAPMLHCCWPNHVQLLDGCYLWCQIPEPRPDEKDSLGNPKPKLENADDIRRNFTSCLTGHSDWDISVNRGIQVNIPNLAGGRVQPPGTTTLSAFALGLLALTSFVLA